VELVEYLVQHGWDALATEKGNTTIHSAAMSGKLDVVSLLAKKGVSVRKKGDKKQTALHVAAGMGHLETVRLLLDLGRYLHTFYFYFLLHNAQYAVRSTQYAVRNAQCAIRNTQYRRNTDAIPTQYQRNTDAIPTQYRRNTDAIYNRRNRCHSQHLAFRFFVLTFCIQGRKWKAKTRREGPLSSAR
jgi:ankyrin repeat protein